MVLRTEIKAMLTILINWNGSMKKVIECLPMDKLPARNKIGGHQQRHKELDQKRHLEL